MRLGPAFRSHLIPDQWVDTVCDVDIAALARRGIKGLILDLDDTLVCEGKHEVSDQVCAWLKRAQSHMKVMILSNNRRLHRVAGIAHRLDLPFIHLALKPLLLGFKRALSALDLRPTEVAVIGDQVFTDVLGGRRLGAHTILVKPISPWERKWLRRVMRRAERLVLGESAKSLSQATARREDKPGGAARERARKPANALAGTGN